MSTNANVDRYRRDVGVRYIMSTYMYNHGSLHAPSQRPSTKRLLCLGQLFLLL
jgi:hypothetical protein